MVGRNQRMPNWRGSTPAPPIRRATRSACPPMSRARSSSVASWTAWLIGSTSRQSPDGLRPPNTMSAPLHADDRRSGQGREPLRGDLLDQARFQSDEPRRANEIAFDRPRGRRAPVRAPAAPGRRRCGNRPRSRTERASPGRAASPRQEAARSPSLSSSLSRPGLARRRRSARGPRCSPGRRESQP